MEKLNIRGEMNALPVNGVLELPKSDYRPASVRSTAASLRENENKAFLVSVSRDLITVTRTS